MSVDSIITQVTGGFDWKQLSWETLVRTLLVFIIGYVVMKMVLKTIDRIISHNSSLKTIHRYLHSCLSVIFWIVLVLVTLGSLGMDMTSIIALMSVAGLAVSLALQNTLSNLAGGIMIMVSKPFSIGDYVDVDSVSGTVSMVGLVYSTLVTAENKEIYIPNSQVSSAKITNYTRLGKRRFELTFSTSYDTPTERAKAALQDVVNQFPEILQDPAPVIWLSEYASSSINYIVRAWTTTEDYWNVYYRFLEAVRPTFEKYQVEMPYIHLNVHMIPSK